MAQIQNKMHHKSEGIIPREAASPLHQKYSAVALDPDLSKGHLGIHANN